MGIFRRIITLPLAPVEGVIWLAEQLEEQAAEQFYGPDAIRREMAALNAEFDRGELSPEEFEEEEGALLQRLEIAMSGARETTYGT